MKMMFCIYDTTAKAYMPPFTYDNRGLAIRVVSDMVNRPNQRSVINDHPDHFVLFEVAEFDEVSGEIKPLSTGPVRLIGLHEVVEKPLVPQSLKVAS